MKIAILLHGGIKHDGRVRRTIAELEKYAEVYLYYLNGEASDRALFSERVQLRSINYSRDSLSKKIIAHSAFYREYLFLEKHVLAEGVQFDYCLANDLPVLLPGIRIARKLESKLIYDSHEIFNETLNQVFPKDSTPLKKGIFKVLLYLMRMLGTRFEKQAFKQVDTSITVNDALADHFANRYEVARPKVVRNVIDSTAVHYKEAFDLSSVLKIDREARVAIYQGVLNAGRGLELLVEAMKYVDAQTHLLIVGDGYLGAQLKKQARAFKLEDRIHFTGRVPYEQLMDYTRAADFGICLLEPFNLSKYLALPNKIFEYALANIPVLVSDGPECKKIVDQYEVGAFTGLEPKSIAEAINTLATGKFEVPEGNFEKLLDDFSWEKQAITLRAVFAIEAEHAGNHIGV